MTRFHMMTWNLPDHLTIYAIVDSTTTQAVALYHDINEAKIELAIRNFEHARNTRANLPKRSSLDRSPEGIDCEANKYVYNLDHTPTEFVP